MSRIYHRRKDDGSGEEDELEVPIRDRHQSNNTQRGERGLEKKDENHEEDEEDEEDLPPPPPVKKKDADKRKDKLPKTRNALPAMQEELIGESKVRLHPSLIACFYDSYFLSCAGLVQSRLCKEVIFLTETKIVHRHESQYTSCFFQTGTHYVLAY